MPLRNTILPEALLLTVKAPIWLPARFKFMPPLLLPLKLLATIVWVWAREPLGLSSAVALTPELMPATPATVPTVSGPALLLLTWKAPVVERPLIASIWLAPLVSVTLEPDSWSCPTLRPAVCVMVLLVVRLSTGAEEGAMAPPVLPITMAPALNTVPMANIAAVMRLSSLALKLSAKVSDAPPSVMERLLVKGAIVVRPAPELMKLATFTLSPVSWMSPPPLVIEVPWRLMSYDEGGADAGTPEPLIVMGAPLELMLPPTRLTPVTPEALDALETPVMEMAPVELMVPST